MTRKHFEAIAAALVETKPANAEAPTFADAAKLEQWERSVREVSHRLEGVCPRFNCARFRKACGM